MKLVSTAILLQPYEFKQEKQKRLQVNTLKKKTGLVTNCVDSL